MTMVEDLRDFIEINPIDLSCYVQIHPHSNHINLKIESPTHFQRAQSANKISKNNKGNETGSYKDRLMFEAGGPGGLFEQIDDLDDASKITVLIYTSALTVLLILLIGCCIIKNCVFGDIFQIVLSGTNTVNELNQLSLNLSINLKKADAAKLTAGTAAPLSNLGGIQNNSVATTINKSIKIKSSVTASKISNGNSSLFNTSAPSASILTISAVSGANTQGTGASGNQKQQGKVTVANQKTN